jgi:hypothetical protein
MKGRYSVAIKTFFVSRTLIILADRIIAELNSTTELHVPNAFRGFEFTVPPRPDIYCGSARSATGCSTKIRIGVVVGLEAA